MEYVLLGIGLINIIGLVFLWLSQAQIHHEMLETNELLGGNLRSRRFKGWRKTGAPAASEQIAAVEKFPSTSLKSLQH